MNDAFFKPSLGVNALINENTSIDTEKFKLFLEAYYEWLQTTKITLNSTVGTFQVNEIILGSESGATGKVIQVTSTTLIVKITSERRVFDQYETITGQTSNATSIAYAIKDNIVRASGNLLNYKQIDTSIDKYVSYLKDELYPSLPASYYGNKRLIAKQFRDFFQSKGTEQSYRFLFRLLYDQEIEFYYPGEDILRVSDGNFEKTQIIRTASVAYGYDQSNVSFNRDIFLFINKTIVGNTSGTLANVIDIKKFFVGAIEIAEMTLKLVSGTFSAGESISAIDDANLYANIYGIISGFTIIDGGSGYQVDTPVTITGDGYAAQAKVSSIKQSPISALKINAIGHGYQLNTLASINNTDTGGTGLIVQVTELANTYTTTIGASTYTLGEISRVSIINRGSGYYKKPTITLQDTVVSSAGLLTDKLITIANAGTNYGVGNTLIFTGGSGTSAAGIVASVVESTSFDLLFEDGYQMKADGSYYDIIKNEDWSVKGPIKRLELTNFGSGYTSANLPSISVSTTTGSSANLVVTGIQGTSANVVVDTANNTTGIGSIRSVEVTNFGVSYTNANAVVSSVGDGNANLIPIISGLGIKDGVWLNDDGKIDYKIIQDSYYYQDYSYVIKSGLTFAEYSTTLKKIIHPAGLQMFGEIQILNTINVEAFVLSGGANGFGPTGNAGINKVVAQILYALAVGVTDAAKPTSYNIIIQTPPQNLITDYANTSYVRILPSNVSTAITNQTQLSIITPSFAVTTLQPDPEAYIREITKVIIEHTTGAYGEIYIGDIPISFYSSNTISEFSETRFSDIYSRNDFAISTNYNVLTGARSVDVSANQAFTIINKSFGTAGGSLLVEGTTSTDSKLTVYVPQSNVSAQFSYISSQYIKILPNTVDTSLTAQQSAMTVVSTNVPLDISTITQTSLIINLPTSFDASSSYNSSQYVKILSSNINTESSYSQSNVIISYQSNNDLQLNSISSTSIIVPKQPIGVYGTAKYKDVMVGYIADGLISDYSSDTFLNPSTQPLTELLVESETNKYVRIAGTVSSANITYGDFPVSSFASVPIANLASVTFGDSQSGVIGSGTNFVSDFSSGSVFLANNEYFKVSSVANTTAMFIDRFPMNPFSGVNAYKIPSPTYTFSSIPTSINEGANGTFSLTTTDVSNGISLYWTINNVTTSAGDFV